MNAIVGNAQSLLGRLARQWRWTGSGRMAYAPSLAGASCVLLVAGFVLAIFLLVRILKSVKRIQFNASLPSPEAPKWALGHRLCAKCGLVVARWDDTGTCANCQVKPDGD